MFALAICDNKISGYVRNFNINSVNIISGNVFGKNVKNSFFNTVRNKLNSYKVGVFSIWVRIDFVKNCKM